MDTSFLNPMGTMAVATGPKLRQINDAKLMQQVVMDRAKMQGIDPPPYEFLELIGKGTYGRVYKSKCLKGSIAGQVVAVKIIEVDKPDYYESSWETRDDTIQNFTKEISALQRLRDGNAKNITMIYDAFNFHSQLWLVSEYCHGGSVSTLLRACPERRLEEQFIIPVARELAVALKYIHEADIVHRDIKCANILIMEDGTLRLADFGVAGIFDSHVDKRRTIIGTPHWMPLELVKELGNQSPNVQYGTEVDIWAYGCAVYEMATGHGPNQWVRPTALADALRESAPRLDSGGSYSSGLCDFVEYCLQNNPRARPTATQVLESPYLAATNRMYPTELLQRLVERFFAWERKGGERKSLFINAGAALPDNLGEADEEEEWYFSTTLAFEQRLEDAAHEKLYDSIRAKTENTTPAALAKMTPRERRLKMEQGASADRGGKALGAIFDPSAAQYTYSDRPEPPPTQRRTSDLPLRNMGNDMAANRTTLINLDDAFSFGTSVPNLADIRTLRANRGGGKGFSWDSEEEDSDAESKSYNRTKRDSNRKTKDWTMPLLSAPADPNVNRRTVDWKFPSMTVTVSNSDEDTIQNTARKIVPDPNANNRDTMAFSFPMAPAPEPTSAKSEDAMGLHANRPLERPGLRSAVTMPTGMAGEFQLLVSPSDRFSIIDLDEATRATEQSRPSTSHSVVSFAEYGPKQDSFNLEDQADSWNRGAVASANNNRASLHRQSQSEPNARSSKGSEIEAQLEAEANMVRFDMDSRPPPRPYPAQPRKGDVKRNDSRIETQPRDRRRMYNRGSDESSTGYYGDARPYVAGVYEPSGYSKRNGNAFIEMMDALSLAIHHGRRPSQNAFMQARLLQPAKASILRSFYDTVVTRYLYLNVEGSFETKPYFGIGVRQWKKLTVSLQQLEGPRRV